MYICQLVSTDSQVAVIAAIAQG